MLYKTTEGKFIDVYSDEGKTWLRLRIAELLGWEDVEEEHDYEKMQEYWVGWTKNRGYYLRLPDWTSNADDANKLVSPSGATCEQWDYQTLNIHSYTVECNYGARFVDRKDSQTPFIVTNNYALSRCVAWLEHVDSLKLPVDKKNE